MLQLLARVGISRPSLQASQAQLAKWGRSAGTVAGEGFISGFGGQAGATAFAAIFDKLFAKKKQPSNIVEQYTGINPRDPLGVGFRIKAGLAAAGTGVIALGAAGAHSAMMFKDFSEQTDLSIEEVQNLNRAARSMGLGFDFAARAVDNFAQARKDAGSDMKTRGLLIGMGLSTEEILGNESDLSLMRKIRGGRRRDMRALFGKGGEKVPALMAALAGPEGQGLNITPENVKKIDAAGKGIARLGQTIKNAGANMLGTAIATAQNIVNSESWYGRYLRAFGGGARNIARSVGGMVGAIPPGAPPSQGAAMAAAAADTKEEQRDEILEERRGDLFRKFETARDAERRLRFEQMSSSQQEADLRRRIAEQVGFARDRRPQMAEFRADALAQADALKLQLVEILRSQVSPMQFDSLASIGGHTGNVGGNEINFIERIASASEETARNTRPGADSGGYP